MKFPPPDHRFLRFRTDEYPAHQRLDAWREVLSQLLLKAELRALAEEPFGAEATLRALTGIRFGTGKFTASVHSRTPAMVAADNDDLLLITNLAGPLSILLNGQELVLREGDACLLSCRQVYDLIRHGTGTLMFVRMERACLLSLIPDVERYVGQVLMRANEALAHLTTFLRKLDERQPLESEALKRIVVTHIVSVLALALDSGRADKRHSTQDRPSVTRLATIQRYIIQHLAEQELSVASVAEAYKVSPRQLQRLFEASGATFSEFLLTERLKSVHVALLDTGQSEGSVSDIALANGFGDVSYFNRAFRRQYGCSPSQIRRAVAASPVAAAI